MSSSSIAPPTARPKQELPPVPKEITLSEGVTVKELAQSDAPHIWVPHSLGALKKRNIDPSAWADLRIGVPRGKGVAVYLAVGETEVGAVDGDLLIDTGSGAVHARGGSGSLNVDTGSGEVSVEEFEGELLVDTGSGYNTQSVVPVHVGLPGPGEVDVEVSFPGGGSRLTTVRRGVDPLSEGGQPVTVRVANWPGSGRSPSISFEASWSIAWNASIICS